MLQKKTLELVASFNIFEFKASNCWLEAFRKKNVIKYLRINGEEGATDVELCNQWFSKLNQIIANYSEKISIIWTRQTYYTVGYRIKRYLLLLRNVKMENLQIKD